MDPEPLGGVTTMAYARYTDERGTIGVFATRTQAERRNFGPSHAPEVVAVEDHEHTVYPVPSCGVLFHPRDQSHPKLVAALHAPTDWEGD
jgi:hypothetical protein